LCALLSRVRGEVDRRRIPLETGDDPGEEAGPEAALCEDEVSAHRAFPELLVSHGGTVQAIHG
jgi:hypothetical protein